MSPVVSRGIGGIVLRTPVRQIMTALIRGPKDGYLEPKIASEADLTLKQVHRWVSELVLFGVLLFDDTVAGNRVRLNPDSPHLDALRLLLPPAPSTRATLMGALRGAGTDLNVAVVFSRKPSGRPLILATTPDDAPDAERRKLRSALQDLAEPLLPTVPRVVVHSWSAWRNALIEGDDQLQSVWQRGIQVVGVDAITHDAAAEVLRVRVHRLSERLRTSDRVRFGDALSV